MDAVPVMFVAMLMVSGTPQVHIHDQMVSRDVCVEMQRTAPARLIGKTWNGVGTISQVDGRCVEITRRNIANMADSWAIVNRSLRPE